MTENRRTQLPVPPEEVPRLGNGFTQAIGRLLLRLCGWRVKGQLPNISKCVYAAAPHTSNWDFVIAMIAILAMGVKISYLMKKEAFFWPFAGLFKALGGIPLDRSAAEDTVSQAKQWFGQREKIWLVITPEGTRAKVERWKTGFLRIAERANVPVLLVAWDYPSKTLYIDSVWPTTGHHDADAAAIREHICARYHGKFPEKQ